MAINSRTHDSHAESVKKAVGSTATCTATTLSSLQLLLQATLPISQKTHLDNKPIKRSQSTASSKTITRAKTTRSRNPTIASKVEITQTAIVAEDAEGLSIQQRLVLATEVFNAASKALSDALHRNSSPKSPLQPTSPNRIVPSMKKQSIKPTKTLSSIKRDSENGVSTTAECAILALATLRNLKSDQPTNAIDPNLQLEQGACILAGRLIALGINDLAYKELRGLKRRLQDFMSSTPMKGSKDLKSRTAQATKAESGRDTAAELLSFSDMESAAPVLPVLVSFQSNVLKLITSEKKISVIEKTCKVLYTAVPSSPASVIMRSVDSGSLGKDKAAVQLLSSSNTILSWSSILHKTLISGSDSTMDRSARFFSSFTLQLLSMEYRVLSWKLSGHICDSKREFWDPLSRFLEVFCNSDSKIKPSEFRALSETVQRLQLRMTTSQTKGEADSWKINYNLGKIAQNASCLEEALKYVSLAAETVTEDHSMASSFIQCRMAFLHLCLWKDGRASDSETVVKSLNAAALGMKSANKGTVSDLEALLVESGKLKKLAMARIGESVSSGTMLLSELTAAVVDYLQAFVRFLRRYFSCQPQNEAESETDVKLPTITNTKNIIITAAESATVLGKMSLLNHLPPWELIQPVLSDCARLLSSFDNTELEESGEGLSWRATNVKISNLYWSRYLKRREAGQGYAELIPLLDNSISLLQGCSTSERATAFAALKLERLAHLYLDARMGAKSMACFERSIQEHIDAGALQQQMEYLSGRPPHVSLHDSSSPGYNLTRVLSAHIKMQLRRPSNDENGTLNTRALNLDARGFLLEWQLGLLTEFYSHDAQSERFKVNLQSLLSEVLALYPVDQYPIQRLRVIRLILRFALDHPGSLDTETAESLAEASCSQSISQVSTSNDLQLVNYAPYIRASLDLILLFREGAVKADNFRDIIAFWASTVRDCTTWDTLQSVVDDSELLIAQIKAASDYLEARGYWKLHLAACEILIRVYEIQKARDNSSLILALSRCALQYCRLGDHKASNELLGRAGRYFEKANVPHYTAIIYQLALAEYNIEIGNLDCSEKALLAAQKLYQNQDTQSEIQLSRGQSKIEWERAIIDGALLYSRIADQRKSLEKALYFGKLAVRLSTRLWAKLERSAGRKRESERSTENLSNEDLIIDGVANLDLSVTTLPSVWSYTDGAVFWKHVASHNACFLNLMRLSAYNGLFQDAIYYGEQALKVNESLGTSFRLLTCQAELGLEWIRGNHLTEAKDVLDAAAKLSEDLINSVETVKLKISLAALCRSQGKYDEVLNLLREAEMMLGRISEVRIDSSLSVKSSDTGLEGKMANLKIRQASFQKETEMMITRQTRKSKTVAKSRTRTEENIAAPESQILPQSLVVLRNEIIRQQIHTLLAIEDLDGASRLLDIARSFSSPTASQISIQIEETEHLLADAMKSIATHAVYCVLPESTLSMPSIEAVVSAAKSAVAKSKKPVTKRGNSTTREPRSRTTKTAKADIDVASIMSQAKSAISITVRDAFSTGSTVEGHTASSLMGRVSMLLHATTPGLLDEDILTPVNANEIGRITAFDRERLAISIDKSLSGFSDQMTWPANMLCNSDGKADIIANFTQNYVDILPDGWNVMSISLNADRTEFIISRMCHGDSPFLLRLPLKRSDEGGQDEDDFTFDWGKDEMKEIIKLANASAHDAKNRVDRKSKKEWWNTRESLDRRLETLLYNMENIWLGGFRGIFDASPRNSERLAEFATSFEAILDKHLPSRRKSKNTKDKIKVHENVLSLFTGLKGLGKQEDPEEPILDLLYFVVDILQFQGERNAYDEIDFDMMVIDTLDILNGFQCNDAADIGPPNHTILILDKSLHSFPWESLPCLHGLPITRMPSLECLRARINQFNSSEIPSDEAFQVDRRNGHFILNPSGDLKSTQSTFEQELLHMEGWSAVVGRTPSEEEFKSGLEDKDIFLYFGHGSGAQYIRGRTIKRLEKCAVAFLMGCSSGCLTEAGELEPYGTPMNYMQAGSPALVATLWDVTDKDIDRFAKSTFQRWGLLQHTEDGDTGKKTLKGKESVQAGSKQGSPSSLDEAVAQSRNSCLLKYLNGAAPVIYGIPVYLSK